MRIEREVNLVPAVLRDTAKNLVSVSPIKNNPATFTARSNAHNQNDIFKALQKIWALLEDESSGGGCSGDGDYDPDHMETVSYANISSIDSIATHEDEEQETQLAPVMFSSQFGEPTNANNVSSEKDPNTNDIHICIIILCLRLSFMNMFMMKGNPLLKIRV